MHILASQENAMVGLRRLSLEDLPRYKAAFAKERRIAWQHYFPFHYLFSVTAKEEYTLISEEGGSLCVYRRILTANGPRLLLASLPMPMNIAALERCLERIREHNQSQVATIIWVDEEDIAVLNRLGRISAKPYQPDYLYDPKIYKSLSGDKTSNLRKNLSRMRAQKDVELRAYTQDDSKDCLALLDDWSELQKDKHDKILYQRFTRNCLKFADHFEARELFGRVVLIDGKIRSFGFGGEMRPGLGNLFLAYSDHRIKGLNYFLKTQLMLAMEDYDLINSSRADTPGLKYAKESFCPVAMHNVYLVKIESVTQVLKSKTPDRQLVAGKPLADSVPTTPFSAPSVGKSDAQLQPVNNEKLIEPLIEPHASAGLLLPEELAGQANQIAAPARTLSSEENAMAGLRRISLEDLPRYKAVFEKERRLAWHHYFPYLHLFSVRAKSEYILISEEGGSLCVYRRNMTANGSKLYLHSLPMPMNTAVLEGCLARIREHNQSRDATVLWVDEEDLRALNGSGFITAAPYEPNYLFDPQSYKSLSGEKTKNLRKNLSYMRVQDDVELRAYTQGDMADCLALLNDWAEVQKDKHEKIINQRFTRACLKFADQFEARDLFGRVVLIDGKIRSFGFGGEMRTGLGNLFVAYSDHRIKGLNYFLKTQLMLAMEDCDLVNDGRADTPGLKYSKESLCPASMHNVYRVKIELATQAMNKLMGGNTPQRPATSISGRMETKLEKHVRSRDMNVFIKAAKNLSLDFEIIGKEGPVFCRISHESKHLLLRHNTLSLTSTVHRQMVSDKYLTLQLFEKADVPCPKARLFGIEKEKEILAYVAANRPVVIKPKSESLARGVCVKPQDDKAVLDAIHSIRELKHNSVQVESYIEGNDYRFLLYDGELMGVVKWIPPYVVGDGVMTIKELIGAKNAYRADNRYSAIVIEPEVIERQGFAMDSMLPMGMLCNVNSRSGHTIGGETTRVDPAKIHPDNLEACFRAAQATDLVFSGVDMISKDISISYRENGAAINEINACPMIDPHYFADAGEDTQEAEKVLKKYFELQGVFQ